jgi:hypothetical protein
VQGCGLGLSKAALWHFPAGAEKNNKKTYHYPLSQNRVSPEYKSEALALEVGCKV